MEDLVKKILHGYGLTSYSLFEVQKGYRNQSFPVRLDDGSMLNLILYKREPDILARIRRANEVANYVFNCGFPARHTFSSRIARVRSSGGETYAALYEYLPGDTIPWEAYSQKHIKLLGKTLSDLHTALQRFDTHHLPSVTEEYLQIIQYMRWYFASDGVHRALAEKLGLKVDGGVFDKYEMLLEVCGYLPEQQALHMDFVRSNILFLEEDDEPRISGILDFEKTARGNKLFDIGRTLAFLLVDCKYKQSDKIHKYFLHSGYQKRGTAEFANISVKTASGRSNLLDQLLNMFLLYDFYKFLKHNPYEYLYVNEHFVRTRDLLLQRGDVTLSQVSTSRC